jgi:hypothetical protein
VHAQFVSAVPEAFRAAVADAGASAPMIPVSIDDTGLGIEPVPGSVTARQLRLELLQFGRLDDTEAYVAGARRRSPSKMPSSSSASIPFLCAAAVLGVDQHQVDDMFRRAARL